MLRLSSRIVPMMARQAASRAAARPMATEALAYSKYPFLKELGLEEHNKGCFDGEWKASGDVLTSYCPATEEPIATVQRATLEEYEEAMAKMEAARPAFAEVPMPVRGELVRKIGCALREKLEPLGKLVSLEMGKILAEGIGEVQEYIDMCDFATGRWGNNPKKGRETGLSRTISGGMMPSERKDHYLVERWNPLGMIGIITAFNFPVAVFGWNNTLSLVCGNPMVWKGSSTTNLTSVAVTKIVSKVLEEEGYPGEICSLVAGGPPVGDAITDDPRLRLVSFTGSTEIGQGVNERVSKRFGRTILELGGNNATIVMDDADVDMALRAVVFAAVGTAGQRCTSCRRLFLHEKVYDDFIARLKDAYASVKIGNPLDEGVLMGPLHTSAAVEEYEGAIKQGLEQGGELLYGGKVLDGPGHFVEPALIAIEHDTPIVYHESFVPVLWIHKIKSMEEAFAKNNAVPQGLSSTLFTNDLGTAMKWIGPSGSDCGLVNINTGTSGAEIGGAFGGEKETGGGREAGSDSWKQYMKRGTSALNFGSELPLAQGIEFA